MTKAEMIESFQFIFDACARLNDVQAVRRINTATPSELTEIQDMLAEELTEIQDCAGRSLASLRGE